MASKVTPSNSDGNPTASRLRIGGWIKALIPKEVKQHPYNGKHRGN